MGSTTLVFDIETDGLLLELTTMHVGVTYCKETKTFTSYRDPYALVQALQEADVIVAHNGVGFDLAALEKLTGIYVETPIIDTLLLAKLAYYDVDKNWSHSLRAYGERLGFAKGDYDDWSKYTPEMEEYCKRDVEVTTKLLAHLKRKTPWLPKEALELEQEVQRIVTQQYINGWEFDVSKAQKLHIELMKEKDDAEIELFRTFKPKFLPKGKVKIPKKAFRRLGVWTMGQHQPIGLTEFNPGSGHNIVWWVERVLGPQEWILTEKGNPKTDADTLQEMFKDEPFLKPLLHYLEVNKLLGQLAEGPKAWLKLVGTDGRLHGQVNILGAVTGRATHSDPNMAQVPSLRAYKGKEARDLFTVPKGKTLVAADLSGVELRCLAHYMARHDGGEYADIILEGDIHTANMEAAGLHKRDQAKTMIYGYLFGAGDAKLGLIVGGGAKEGRRIRTTFERKIPALKKLQDGVKKASKRGYLVGITGRRLHVRSPHSALNTLLQSLGGYVSKYWMIEVHKKLKAEGIDARQLAWIHDEIEFECDSKDADRVIEILEESALVAGETMGMRMPIHAEAQKGERWSEVH